MKRTLLLIIILVLFTLKNFSQSTNCTTASNLALTNGSACVNGTSAGAITDNILYGTCNTVPVNVVWYTYVTTGSNNTFTITPGTLTNAEIIIYLGGCPNTGTLQSCVVANGSNVLTTNWGMPAGVQVWIGIASNNGVSGSFQFCVNSIPPTPGPGNTCAQATQICNTTFTQPSMAPNASGQTPNCFLNPAQRDIWLKFTITQAGSLRWTATPNNPTAEFDWALWDITNGCPGTVACCNYNFANGSSAGFGMQAQAGTVTCGSNGSAGTAAEFCGPMNVVCGKTYALQISNYFAGNSTGFTLNFGNSTAMINSNAAFSVSAPTLVCGASLNAIINNASTGACGEVWNYGDGSATYTGTTPPSHVYTTPGTYAITANIGGACPSSATQFVQLLAPLAATATSSPVSCPGSCNGSATVNPVTGGDGIYTYLWSTGSTSTSINSLCAGIYSITVSNAKCSSSVTQTVNITSPPPLTLTANPVVAACGGSNGSISLTGSGGASPYTYNMNGGAFTSATTYSNLATGNYTMGVQDSKNCQTTITVNIATTSGPTVTVNSATICAGTPAVLTATGANTYSWSPATGLSATSGTSVSASPAVNTTYTVIGSIGGCTGSVTTLVTVNPLPVPAATNTGPYCQGNTVQLNVGAFNTYTWSGPAFTSGIQNPTIPTATPANSGIYTVTVSDANGCVNSSTTNVTVNPTPTPVIGSNSPVCLNNAINLTAGGATSYTWNGPGSFVSTIQNPTITSASPTNAGVYSLTVSALSCTNTATVSVMVNTPTTTAVGGGPYCAGSTIQLTTPAASSYTWSGPAGFSSGLQNPTIASSTTLMTGTYTVLVSFGSCTATATTSLTVNNLPTPAATNTGPYCPGNTVQLNVGAFTTYTWSGPGAYSSSAQNPSITLATTANSGVYTASVTDANGCVNSSTTNVTVNPTPTPVIGSNSPVCLNNAINLTAGGATSYTWSGPGSFISTIQNPTITSAAPTNAGVYSLTVSVLSCTNTATVNVVVNSPTTSATGGGPYCAGATIQLTTPVASSYTWTGPAGFTSGLQNPTIASSTTLMTGNYTVLVTSGGCTATASTSLTVNALPVPVLNNNSPVCVGKDVVFSASGGSVYAWAGPGGYNSAAQNPTISAAAVAQSGTYTLTVADANNCVNTAVTQVTVNASPVVAASGATVCENANAQLGANGGVFYSWSGPGGYTSAQQNPLITNAALSDAGQYSVLITDANTCTNTAIATLQVNAAAVPQMASNGPICAQSILQLNATGGNQYAWTGPNGFVSAVQNPSFVATSTAVSGVYQVSVNLNGGCGGTATLNVVVNPLPVLVLTSGPNKGCAPLCINYIIQSTPTASAVAWNFGNGATGSGMSPTTCFTSDGIYSITSTVTDINGCISSATSSAEVYPKPVADFVTSPVKPIENLDEVSFTDLSHGTPIVDWNWYMGLGAPLQYTTSSQNPYYTYQEAGNYPVVLVVKSDKGCIDTLIKIVSVVEDFGIWVPNAFTPNGDGVNDYFSAKGFGIVKFQMQIFDRWGESIFFSDNIQTPWMGNFQGKGDAICQDDVYVWKIKVSGPNGKPKEMVGHVTLLK